MWLSDFYSYTVDVPVVWVWYGWMTFNWWTSFMHPASTNLIPQWAKKHQELCTHLPTLTRQLGVWLIAKDSLFLSDLQTGQDALLVSTTLYIVLGWACQSSKVVWCGFILGRYHFIATSAKLYTQSGPLQMAGISHSQASSFHSYTLSIPNHLLVPPPLQLRNLML